MYWVGEHQGGFLKEVMSKLSEDTRGLEPVLGRAESGEGRSVSPRRADLPIIIANNLIEH